MLFLGWQCTQTRTNARRGKHLYFIARNVQNWEHQCLFLEHILNERIIFTIVGAGGLFLDHVYDTSTNFLRPDLEQQLVLCSRCGLTCSAVYLMS